MKPQILLSESDARRVRLLAGSSKGLDPTCLGWLREAIDRAEVVADGEVPEDVISLHSPVEVEDLETGEIDSFMLVMPAEADPARGRISFLAPLGRAMLGIREGDCFECHAPGGKTSHRVRRVLGSRIAAGRYHELATDA